MRSKWVVRLVVMFVFGMAVGVLVAAGDKVGPSAYEGKSADVAGKNLCDIALGQAGKGSWERIAVGRVHYLAGRKEKGQAIFDEYLGGRGEPSDSLRIARVYMEAGEWDKAEPALRDVVNRGGKKAKWLVEAGAYYNLQGDREKAEELFNRAFARSSGELSTQRQMSRNSGLSRW